MQADPRVFERRHARSEFPINFRCPERGVLVSGLEKIFAQKARPKVSRRACRSLLFILLFRDTARPLNRNQFSIRRDRLTSIPTGSYRKLRAFRRRESESADSARVPRNFFRRRDRRIIRSRGRVVHTEKTGKKP